VGSKGIEEREDSTFIQRPAEKKGVGGKNLGGGEEEIWRNVL